MTIRDGARALAKAAYERGLMNQPTSQRINHLPAADGAASALWAIVHPEGRLQTSGLTVANVETAELFISRDPDSEAGGVAELKQGDKFALEDAKAGEEYAFVGEVIAETAFKYQIRVERNVVLRRGVKSTG